MMKRSILLAFALNAMRVGFANEGPASNQLTGEMPSPSYRQTLKVNSDAFLKALALDRKTISGPYYYLPGPYGVERPLGSGVLAPESAEEFIESVSPVLKAQRAARNFFTAKGVDWGTRNSNTIFFNYTTSTLYVEGSLHHVLLVGFITKELDGVLQSTR
ncbi:MAG TPA: hypothetical protein VK633_14475 [Verrucomicrobiae bacterium]|nr:hypothetical protein [Verrucomicrobiae bacterium]